MIEFSSINTLTYDSLSWQGQGDKNLEVLEGVGHWQCIEAPEQVLKLLDGFANPLVDTI